MVETPPGPISAEEQARLSYERSQTFLAKLPNPSVVRLRQISVGVVIAVFFLLIPLMNLAGVVEDYKLNLLGKYLCFAIAALGIDLIWGYTGLLSLCQALFFSLGGYAMAMHLSVKAGGGDVRPEYNDIPQFMFFNNVRELPWFWKPFQSMPFAIFAGLMLPCLVASIFGFFIFRSRVRGVYFSIITQALAWGAWLLISRNEMLLGGTNGLTNFYKPLSESRPWIIALYFLTLFTLMGVYLFCRAITTSRLGRVLVAIRDRETRLYFAGYQPYAFKVFAFAVGAMIAAVGGMLYSPQVGIITPQNMSVPTSILMVIWVALGGRGKLWGAIYGALLVNVSLSSLSSDLPSLWLFVQGGMFLAVVLFFPD
jgi:urea transport system permease protein